MEITTVSNVKQVEELLNKNSNDLKILYFCIDDSAECNQMSDVISELRKSEEYKNIVVIKIDASKQEEICKKYDVTSVPTFLFYLDTTQCDKLIGANAPVFSKKLEDLVTKSNKKESSEEDLNTRLKKLINKASVMLFMKGNPSAPRCGFSKQVIALLNSHNAKYETFDILEDWDVREGLKTFSNWPTYPQLYIDGELIGGLDILKELSQSGELDSLLQKNK